MLFSKNIRNRVVDLADRNRPKLIMWRQPRRAEERWNIPLLVVVLKIFDLGDDLHRLASAAANDRIFLAYRKNLFE